MQNTEAQPLVRLMDQLLDGNYQVQPYGKLELPHQLAIGHYMAIDGEAWCDALPANAFWPSRHQQLEGLKKCLPRMVELYADVLFGVTLLPRQALQDALMRNKDISGGHADWNAYRTSYLSGGDIPQHPTTNRWPVILSDYEDEILEDGWHRLHCYLARDDETIPAVFFPRDRHLKRPLT